LNIFELVDKNSHCTAFLVEINHVYFDNTEIHYSKLLPMTRIYSMCSTWYM